MFDAYDARKKRQSNLIGMKSPLGSFGFEKLNAASTETGGRIEFCSVKHLNGQEIVVESHLIYDPFG